MRNSWARAFLERFEEFLDEDTTMTPSWFNGSTKRLSPREVMNEFAARDAAIGALSEAAKQERTRRALQDQFYAQRTLIENGICPECLYELAECQCERSTDVS